MSNAYKVCLVTNIPTPYRNFCFKLLSDEFKKYNVEFVVFYMGETEPSRLWVFPEKDFGYSYKIYSGISPFVRGVTWYFNPRLLIDLYFGSYDVVIMGGYHSPTQMLSFLISLFKMKLLVLWSESNFISEERKNGLAQAIKRTIIRSAQLYYTPGQEAVKFIKSYAVSNISDERFISFPNLIDDAVFIAQVEKFRANKINVRAKFNITPSQQFWLSAARLEEIKGFQEIIPLLEGIENVVLVIVGEGGQQMHWANLAKQYQVNLIMPGYASEAEMAELLAAADLFVLPSLRDPFPLSVIEAIAAGLPVFVSNRIGNYKEVLSDGVNGWGVDVTDHEATKNVIRDIAQTDTIHMKKMGEASREIFLNRFDSHKVISSVVEKTLKRLSV